jgi:hypothetical protein
LSESKGRAPGAAFRSFDALIAKTWIAKTRIAKARRRDATGPHGKEAVTGAAEIGNARDRPVFPQSN